MDAQRWADHLAATNTFFHETNSPYGENLYFAQRSSPISDSQEITGANQAWYDDMIFL